MFSGKISIMHPSKRIQGSKSNSLSGKTIVLGVCSSISAVKAIELARELIRHGAEVQAVMSFESQKIIHPNALEFATGKKPITGIGKRQLNFLKKITLKKPIIELTGKVEHVDFFGIGGKADLLLIAPCTANTISKIAMGIDDTPVTTFASTAIGSKTPVIVVPAMHGSMYENPLVKENIEKLKKLKVKFVNPLMEENKAKFPSIEEIVLECERTILSKQSKFFKKKILIVSGASRIEIDPIRVLTNKSSGKTGIELAKEAYRKGASVAILHNLEAICSGIKNIKVFSFKEFEKGLFLELEKGCDFLLMPAAISDFSIKKSKTKIKSNSGLKLKFSTAPKLIEKISKNFPKLFIVGFKAETGFSEKNLIDSAKNLLEKIPKGFVVANNAENSMEKDSTKAFIVSKNFAESFSGTKKELAEKIFEKIPQLSKFQ